MKNTSLLWLVFCLLAAGLASCTFGGGMPQAANQPAVSLTPDFWAGKATPTLALPSLSPEQTPLPPQAAPVEPAKDSWQPPLDALAWRDKPVRGAVIELGVPGNENTPLAAAPIERYAELYNLSVPVIVIEFQYAWTIEPPYQAVEEQFDLVGAALDRAAGAGLAVILSVRNGPGRNDMLPGVEKGQVINSLYRDPAAQQAYIAMLQDVVGRFKDRPEIIAWEPLVEPAPDYYLFAGEEAPFSQAAALWNPLAQRFIDAIREVDAQRPILISPVNWGSSAAFQSFVRFNDDNIIYSVHTYDPYEYTHQEQEPFNAYPGMIAGETWDFNRLDVELGPVDAFQAQNNVPIIVGEWGGKRWLPGMQQYLTDQIAAFEKRGWSWMLYAWYDAAWEQSGFELQWGAEQQDAVYNPLNPLLEPVVQAWQKNRTLVQAGENIPQETSVVADYWQPAAGETWYWQTGGQPLDIETEATIVAADVFDSEPSQIEALQARSRKVICQINVGTWEDWREDKDLFPPELIGKDYAGGKGEKWLDIRQIEKLASIIQERFDLCKAKGFDAVEPENLDGYANDTGFQISYEDQLRYNRWLANEAHGRGLSIGLNNYPEQAADLEIYDWALSNECLDPAKCELFLPFVVAGRKESTPTPAYWRPARGALWQWQFSGLPLNQDVDASIYDIDAFDNDAALVQILHSQGRKVVCYVNVGAWEDWREDKDLFPAEVIGKDYEGWAGEKWLDIRQIDKLAPIMRARFDVCKAKGFDAIEPDNLDGYDNDTGFSISYADQVLYNRWLADEAHGRGLSIGLKNDPEQTADLLDVYDWAIAEDCFDQDWCTLFSPFINAGKAVVAIEYTDTKAQLSTICPQAKQLGFSVLLKKRELDAWRQVCP